MKICSNRNNIRTDFSPYNDIKLNTQRCKQDCGFTLKTEMKMHLLVKYKFLGEYVIVMPQIL